MTVNNWNWGLAIPTRKDVYHVKHGRFCLLFYPMHNHIWSIHSARKDYFLKCNISYIICPIFLHEKFSIRTKIPTLTPILLQYWVENAWKLRSPGTLITRLKLAWMWKYWFFACLYIYSSQKCFNHMETSTLLLKGPWLKMYSALMAILSSVVS